MDSANSIACPNHRPHMELSSFSMFLISDLMSIGQSQRQSLLTKAVLAYPSILRFIQLSRIWTLSPFVEMTHGRTVFRIAKETVLPL